MQDINTVFLVMVRIGLNFIPLTLLMVGAAWVIKKVID